MCFAGMGRHGPPPMFGDPRMHHGGMWRFPPPPPPMMMMMRQRLPSSSDDNTASEGEGQGQESGACARRRHVTREERKEFRKMAREMGWHPRRWGRGFLQSDSEPEPEAEEKENPEEKKSPEEMKEMKEKLEKMWKEMQEKRIKFREVVQELGVRPWMFKLLAQQIYGAKSEETATPMEEEAADATEDPKEKETKMKKKEKYLEALKELGAHPWMFRVLANQRAKAAAPNQKKGEGENEAAAREETGRGKYHGRGRMGHKMWKQMAEQMGWMSSTSESETTTSESEGEAKKTAEETPEEKKEQKKADRRRMRMMMKHTGWMMPGMMGRWHHPRMYHHHWPQDGDADHVMMGWRHPHHGHHHGHRHGHKKSHHEQ